MRLGRPASIPCAIQCRSPEALALGAAGIACRRRYHCPERGCLVNRSRDCSRLGARGALHARVAITAPSSAAFFLASAALRPNNPANMIDELNGRALGSEVGNYAGRLPSAQAKLGGSTMPSAFLVRRVLKSALSSS